MAWIFWMCDFFEFAEGKNAQEKTVFLCCQNQKHYEYTDNKTWDRTNEDSAGTNPSFFCATFFLGPQTIFFVDTHCNLITMFKPWTAKDAASNVGETWRWRLGREEPFVAAPMLGRWTFTPSNRGAACSQCFGFTNFGEGDLFFVVEARNFSFKMVKIIVHIYVTLPPKSEQLPICNVSVDFLKWMGFHSIYSSPEHRRSWHPGIGRHLQLLWSVSSSGLLLRSCTCKPHKAVSCLGAPWGGPQMGVENISFLFVCSWFLQVDTNNMLWAELYLPIYLCISSSLSLSLYVKKFQSNPIHLI